MRHGSKLNFKNWELSHFGLCLMKRNNPMFILVAVLPFIAGKLRSKATNLGKPDMNDVTISL